jgi:hypothetical protein
MAFDYSAVKSLDHFFKYFFECEDGVFASLLVVEALP